MATQISRDPNFYSQAGQEAGQFGYGTLPPEQALTERSIARKQQIANLLMQRGMQQAQPQGQMAGRFYVAPSPWQGGAGLAQILAGAIGSHYLDAKSKEAEQKAQGNRADAFAQYKSQTEDVPAVAGSAPMAAPQAAVADAMAGQQAAQPPSMEAQPMQGPSASPSVFSGSSPMGPDESGWEPKGPIQDLNAPPAPQQQVAQAMTPPPPTQWPVSPGTPGRPRTSAEKRQAIMDLIANQDPSVSRIGQFLSSQQAAEQEHAASRAQMIAMKEMQDKFITGLTGIKAKDAENLKKTVSGDVGVTQAGAASRTDLGKIQQIDSILEGMDPETPEAKALTDLRTKLSTHPAAATQTVNVDQGVPLVKELMVKGADNVAATLSHAQVSQQSLMTIQQVEDAIKTGKVVTGPGASQQIFLRQLGQVMGVTGKDNEEVLRNTRSAIQGMAKLQIDSSHAAQGQGAISDYERKLFVRAAAGEELSSPEIMELMGAMKKTATYSIALNAKNVEKIRKLPKGGDVVAPFFELPGQGPPGPAPTPSGNRPTVGTVDGGYKFKGGDPAKAENWEKQ